ncbi:hypothetical protein SASPL_145278 [Salvia splendens]|uniref:BED-type domain-containing protein n=1 Tax=Salvia splendens TaxID=180675 RepID=A0A8X8WGS3_SALSN|nr:hypothetical protein SASPL_145278 [Salvia splendens]
MAYGFMLFCLKLQMVDCGSSTQAQPSNILDPDFEMLEDIEIQEMENVIAKEAKKRKVPRRPDIWDVFTKVFVEIGNHAIKVPKGKCNRCEKLIAAYPKLKGTTTMWKHHQSCSKMHTATQEQTMLNQESIRVIDNLEIQLGSLWRTSPHDIGMPIRRVREAVGWINGSPTRSDSFKDITTLLKMTPVVDHTPAPASPTSMANPSDNLRFLEQGLCSQLHIIEEDDGDDAIEY